MQEILDSVSFAKFYRLFSSVYCYQPEDANQLTLYYEPASTLSGVAEISVVAIFLP